MTTTTPYHVIIPALILFVFGNIALYRFVIKVGTKKIIQTIEELGLKYEGIRRIGFLNVGDFNEDEFNQFGPFRSYGNRRISHYRYVDFNDNTGRRRTVTAKITSSFFKTTIDFRPDIKEYAAK